MGNFFSAQINDIKQTTTNDIYQKSEQFCTASCENIQSGNTIFLDGSTTGDIIFKQRCEANAGCMMDNSVETVLDILQDLKQTNATEAQLFGGINFGSVNLNLSDQELRVEVEQILNTICTADIRNEQSDNMIYARNSSTGDIIFEQDGNATANCVMTNAANAQINLEQKGDQTNAITAGGVGGIIGLIIFIVILAIILGVVGKFAKQSGGSPTGGGSGGGQNASSENSGYDKLGQRRRNI